MQTIPGAPSVTRSQVQSYTRTLCSVCTYYYYYYYTYSGSQCVLLLFARGDPHLAPSLAVVTAKTINIHRQPLATTEG